jgi:hypothetical protein
LLRAIKKLKDMFAAGQLSFDLETPRPVAKPNCAAPKERTHPDDQRYVRDLTRAHRELNATKFSGELGDIPIRVSRRMKRRLGHYTLRGQEKYRSEIVISRRHIRRHGLNEAVATLLHEMVHQWQDETGQAVDHGPGFRQKSRAVGIIPRATRHVAR